MKLKFCKSYVGVNAYKISRVWELGFHVFINGGDLIFRFCYFRSKEKTYYIEVFMTIKEMVEVEHE